MDRYATRNPYPFHNPRRHVTCCRRPGPLPRRSWLQRVRDEIARWFR